MFGNLTEQPELLSETPFIRYFRTFKAITLFEVISLAKSAMIQNQCETISDLGKEYNTFLASTICIFLFETQTLIPEEAALLFNVCCTD